MSLLGCSSIWRRIDTEIAAEINVLVPVADRSIAELAVI
jgi:hypothetical protein